MTRLSIELTAEQHKRIRILAAIDDKNIKDFILDRVFGNNEDDIIAIKHSMLLSDSEKKMLINGMLPDGRQFNEEVVNSLRDGHFKRNHHVPFETTEGLFKNILDEDA